MLATSRQEKHANINLDRAIFFSPNTLKHSQSTTLRHLPFSQLPPSSPVPASQSPRPAQYLSRSARPLLPPKPPTLPPKPNRTSYPQSLANTAHLPPIPLPQSLKAASPTPPFRQGEFERITHGSLPTPDFSSLTHATKAETLADRVPTLLPTAESPINHHGAGDLNVGFSPQHVRLRTGDSPDSTRHGSDARQRQTIGQPPCITGNDQSNLNKDTGVANVSKSPTLSSPYHAAWNQASTSFGDTLSPGDPLLSCSSTQAKIPETKRPNTSILENLDINPGQPSEDYGQSMQHFSTTQSQLSTLPSTLLSRIDTTVSIRHPRVKVAASQDKQSTVSYYSRKINDAPSEARKNISKRTLSSLEGSTNTAVNKSPTPHCLLACPDSDYDERIQFRKRCQSVAAIDAYDSDREAVRGELKHAMRSSCPPRCPEEGDGNIFGDLRQSNETQQPCAYFEEFPIHQAMLKCVRIGDETTFCVTGFCEEISHPCLAPDATDSVRIELSSATFEMRSRGASKRQKLSPRKQQPSSLSTNRSRKSWTSAEDRTIMILKQAGKGWPEIAAALPERTEAAVRARYFGKLAKVTGPTIEDQDEFEVEALLARRKGSRTEYLVQWKGYPDEENSWVAQDDISTELVIEYERNHAIHGGLFSGISLLKQDRRGGDDNKYLVQFRGRPSEENMWVCNSEVSGKLIDEFNKLHREG
ncbi:uncharacterized protein FMAN_02062 [Fusarium mangiferae]|uniref:Chromo domain-containing protein n=1 Tax=Fusarium mangiferae TaxID=192010 RepID=A0A1L7SFM3_FUSMA|nr:uncharacterized protein FMAN_02062 [Fusarium mangiferae]CVK85155.1 uncharacterized protein FMAN_02062 [Fusarium mangiferae]